MKTNDTYKTIDEKAEGIFKDKGSKFIAYAFRIENEKDVKIILNDLKKEHHNARHHCYAYRLGFDGETYRANDDGEPSGTAGKPIYGQLLSHEITNVLIVVVRYFGGTLLGVGGLINAYRNASISALQNAKILTQIIENSYKLKFDYPLQSIVTRIIKQFGLEVTNAKYEMDCELVVPLRLKMEQEILAQLEKIDGLVVQKI